MNNKFYSDITINGALILKSSSVTGITISESPYDILSFPNTYSDSAFFDYIVKDNSAESYRSGNIISVWDESSIKYTDYSTSDLGGSTDGIILSIVNDSTNIKVRLSISSGVWDIRIGVRFI